MITILVVDDSRVVREALVDLLDGAAGVTVVGTAEDGDEVAAAFEALQPDIVLMDIAMQRVDGLRAATSLLQANPDARVVLLSGTVSGSLVRRALDAGVVGYLIKGEDPGGLVDAVRRVAAGGTAWSARALAHLPHLGQNGDDGPRGAIAP